MDSNEIIELIKQSEELMQKEDFVEVIKLLISNIQVVEHNWELSWNLGFCYLQSEQTSESEKFLFKSLDLTSDNNSKATCYWAIGLLFLKSKEYDKAKNYFDLSFQSKENVLALIGLADINLEAGNLEVAEKLYRQVMDKNPTDHTRIEIYAKFLSFVGRQQEADLWSTIAQNVKKMQPLFNGTYEAKAPELVRKEWLEEVEEQYKEKVRLGNVQNSDLRSYAVALANNGHFDKAFEISAAISDKDEQSYAHGCIARYMAKAGKIKEAIKISNLLPDRLSESEINTEKIYTLIEIAGECVKSDQMTRARDLLNRSEALLKEEQNPGTSEADNLIQIASLWIELNKSNKAIQLLREAISIINNDIKLYGYDYEMMKSYRYCIEYISKVGTSGEAYNIAMLVEDSQWQERIITWIKQAEKEKNQDKS